MNIQGIIVATLLQTIFHLWEIWSNLCPEINTILKFVNFCASFHFWNFIAPWLLDGMVWIELCLMAERLKYFLFSLHCLSNSSVGKFDFKKFLGYEMPHKGPKTLDLIIEKLLTENNNNTESTIFHAWERSSARILPRDWKFRISWKSICCNSWETWRWRGTSALLSVVLSLFLGIFQPRYCS